MSQRIFRVGTRRSALAGAQTELVVDMLRRGTAGAQIEVVPLSTEGDDRRDVSLRQLGGTGVFVKRIERALLAGEIDLAVHSLKDVPTAIEPGLVLAAFPPRGDPRDALVVRAGDRIESASPACAVEEIARERLPELPYGARIGTGSARRSSQLLAQREDLEVVDVRGNVDTRLRKLDAAEFDALVLAAAGLERLGLAGLMARALDPDELTPMVGQGALVVEARADDEEALRLARRIDDAATRVCVEAERAFLAALGGGCALPLGAFGQIIPGHGLHLRVVLGDATGRRIERRDGRAPAAEANALAARLAEEVRGALEPIGR